MHLERLEKAGLVVGRLELSDDGKALKYFELAPFDVRLNVDTILADRPGGRVRDEDGQHSPEGDLLMDDVIIPVAFFLILAGAVVAVAYFQSQRNRERDRQWAEAMEQYREVVERARSEQEAARLQLVEMGYRLKSVESLLRSVD